ncbi:MAG: ABC transporter six-transmembrane domain-containing protein [Gemmataceae bacterium]
MPSTIDPTLSLAGLFRRHARGICLAYGLLLAENLLALAGPLALGLAVRGVCDGTALGLVWLGGQQAAHLAVGYVRRCYDTRLYAHAQAELATLLVVGQRGQVPTSQLAARAGWTRSLVDFFERDLPTLLQTACGVVGAVVALLLLDPTLGAACLLLAALAAQAGRRYAPRAARLNARLHDQVEREVAVITQAEAHGIADHYHQLRHLRVALSDLEAGQVRAMELGGVVLTLVALFRAGGDPARLTTLLGYAGVFATGLINLPLLLEQLGRLRDLGQRVRLEAITAPDEDPAPPGVDPAPGEDRRVRSRSASPKSRR